MNHVNLTFTADTSQAVNQIKNLQNTLTQLSNQPVPVGQKITDDIMKASNAANELKVHLQNATNVKTGALDFGKLSQSLNASGKTLTQYAEKLVALGPQGRQAFQQLTQSVANAEVPLKKANSLLTKFKDSLIRTAGWQISSSMLHGFIGSISSAYNYSKDLNASLNNIRIVTGKNIDEMARFAEQANRAARALSTTTTAYTDAALIFYQQGLDGSAVTDRADVVIKLANVTGQSAEEVSNWMTSIWNNFDNGVETLESYADKITALGAATASSSEEIATGLEKFASVAETVGLSYDYATAALATVTATTRQSADVVGTAFKTLFARLNDLKLGETLDDGTTLGQYTENLAKVGVNIKDASGQLKDMDIILEETAAKWKELDKDQQVALAKGVAGIRQYNQFIALMSNWDFMKENLETVSEASGALEDQNDIYAESWAAASKKVRASLESIYSDIMKDDFFIELTEGFAKITDFVGGFVKGIGGLQGVLSGLGIILMKTFGPQLSTYFDNLILRINMTEEAIQAAKMAQMQDFINTASLYDTSTHSGAASAKVYEEEARMQMQLIEGAEKLSASEKQILQGAIERHRVLGDQAVELGKQLEASEAIASNNRTDLLGIGVEKTKNIKSVTDELNTIAKRGKSMVSVSNAFKEIEATAGDSLVNTKNLEKSLTDLGMKPKNVKAIVNSFRDLQGGTDDVTLGLKNANKAIEEFNYAKAKSAAAKLAPGLQEDSEEFQNLVNKIQEYMNNVTDATSKNQNYQTSLNNCSKSAKEFSNYIEKAGKKVQTTGQLFTSAISGMMSLGMMISSINGLIDTIKDPNTSGWEKFGVILTSVSMIMMSLSGTIKGLSAAWNLMKIAIDKETIAKVINTIATIAQQKANKKNATIKKDEAVSTALNAEALEEENEEKAKSIILDKATGKSGKLTSGTYKSGNRAGQKWYKHGGSFISEEKYNSLSSPEMTDPGAPGGVSKLKDMIQPGAGKALGKVALKAGAAAAAIAIVATTITVASEQFNKHKKAAEEAANAAKDAATAYESVSQAYNDFTSQVDAYKDSHDELSKLTKGTEEYEEAVLKANESTIKLLETYKDLEYTVDNEGLIIVDEASLAEAKKTQQELLKNAQMANLSAQQYSKEMAIQEKSINFQREKLQSNNRSDNADTAYNTAVGGITGGSAGFLGAITLGAATGPAGWIALGVGAAAAIAGAVVTEAAGQSNSEEALALEKLTHEYEVNGNARFASDSEFKKLLSELNITDEALIDSLTENRTAALELTKEMALANQQRDDKAATQIKEQYSDQMADLELTDKESSTVSSILASELDTKIDELYESTYKDKVGGMTDAEVQKAYAEAMGYSEAIDNQSGNKAKYYKEDGSEVGVISDIVARRYLAEQKAYEELGKSVEKVSKKFKELAKSTNIYDKALGKFISTRDFTSMTQNEYDELEKHVGGEDGKVSEEEIKKYIDANFAAGETLTKEEAQDYGFLNEQAFYDTFYQGFQGGFDSSLEIALQSFSNDTRDLLNSAGFDFNNMSSNLIKQVGSTVEKVSKAEGDTAGQIIANAIELAGEQAEEFVNILNSTDWQITSIKDLQKILKDTGIQTEYTADDLSLLINIMSKTISETFENSQKKIANLEKISQLKQGSTIDAEQYNLLSVNAKSYFDIMADGTYKLTQDAMDFYNLVKSEKEEVIDDQIDEKIKNINKSLKFEGVVAEDLGKTYKINYDYKGYLADKFKDTNFDYSVDETGNLKIKNLGKDDAAPTGYNAYSVSENAKTWRLKTQNKNDDGTYDYSIDKIWKVGMGSNSAVLWDDSQTGNKGTDDQKVSNVYISEKDYKKAEQNKVVKDTDTIEYLSNQIDFIERLDWGKQNKDTIDKWKTAIENNTLTAKQANEISLKANENKDTYKNTVDTAENSSKELKTLFQQKFSNALTSEQREDDFNNLIGELNTDDSKKTLKQEYARSQMSAIAEEQNEGLDLEQVNQYSEYLQEAAKSSDTLSVALLNNDEATQDVARDVMKLNLGVDKLSKGFAEWNDILRKSNKSSQEYQEALANTKDAVSDLLSVDETYLSNSFIESEETLTLLEEAADGSAEAINKLQILAAKSILIDLSADDSELRATLLEYHDSLFNEEWNKSIKIGATIDNETFIADANKIVENAKMTVEEAQAYFSSLGYEPTFVETTITEPLTGTRTITKNVVTKTTKSGFEYIESADTVEEPFQLEGTKKIKVPALSDDGVPQIKMLRKTMNGSMNNMSSSNSGGKTTEKKTSDSRTKKSDMVDRYKEINDKLEENNRLMEKNSLIADTLYGADRLAYLEEEINLLGEKRNLLRQNIEEAQTYLAEDKASLIKAGEIAGISFTFDEDGNIDNYTQQMTELYNQKNNLLDSFGDTTDEDDQKKLDDLNKRIDLIKGAYQQYEDTLDKNKDLEKQDIEMQIEEQQKRFQRMTDSLEIKLSINEDDLQLVEYSLGKIQDDFYSSMEAAALMLGDTSKELGSGGGQLGNYLSNLDYYGNYVDDLETKFTNGEITKTDYVEGLKNSREAIINNLNSLNELDKTMSEYYGNTLAAATERLSKFTALQEHSTSVLDHYSKIVELMGKGQDYEYMQGILDAQVEVAKNSYDSAEEWYKVAKEQAQQKEREYQNQYSLLSADGEMSEEDWKALDWYEKQWLAAQETANKAEENMLAAHEAHLEKMKAATENALNNMNKKYEESMLKNMFGEDTKYTSFEQINLAMERQQSLQEDILTNTNKKYEIDKLIRKTQQDIDKTTNSVAKKEMKAYIERAKAKGEQTELSKTELDILQQEYEVLKAKIALEEAQNAKSIVRLQRDSEGNFGYVYTADEDKVADAQQAYADAENELYNKRLEAANDYGQKIVQTQSELTQTLNELHTQFLNGEFNSEQEYQDAVTAAYEYYYALLEDQQRIYNNIYSDEASWLTGFVSDETTEMKGAVKEQSNLAQESWVGAFGLMTTNTETWKTNTSTYLGNVKDLLIDGENSYTKRVAQAATDAGLSLGNIATATGNIKTKSEELTTFITDPNTGLIKGLDDEMTKVGDLTEEYGSLKEKIGELITEYEKLLTGDDSITARLKAAVDTLMKDNPIDIPDIDFNINPQLGDDSAFWAAMESRYGLKAGGEGGNPDAGDDTGDDTSDDTSDDTGNSKTIRTFTTTGPIKGLTSQEIDELNLITDQTEFFSALMSKTNGKTALNAGNTFSEGIFQSKMLQGQEWVYNTNTKLYYPINALKFDTGGYTGEWDGGYGKLAMLHSKELVLNANETENFLASMELLNNIVKTIDLYSTNAQWGGLLSTPTFGNYNSEPLEQNIHIEASFPNVSNRNEIEEAFTNLVNQASQYANRKY